MGFSVSMKALVSLGVMFIFQLPAMTVLAMFVTSYLSWRQAIPGSSFPSRNSREAPPPVEMCVILSA